MKEKRERTGKKCRGAWRLQYMYELEKKKIEVNLEK